MLALPPFRGKLSEEVHNPHEYRASLSIIRDPYTPRAQVTLIFNSAFPPPPANVGFPIESIAPRASEEWEIVGMTEAEIESRCLPFDEPAMAAFRQGRPVVWVWDPLAELSIGRQEQSRLTNAMRDALAAETQKALTVVTVIRNRNEPRRRGVSRPDVSAAFQRKYIDKVIIDGQCQEYEYDNPSVLFFDIKGKKFKEIYGISPIEFARNVDDELPFFDDFYGKMQNRFKFEDYYFYILKILHRGYRRACALEVAQHGNRHNLKYFGEFYSDRFRSMFGQSEEFKLTTFEYFLIALHSGFNPQQLHPGLARCNRHLGVAAWLGRLGRRDRLLLPRELCLPMLDLLEDDAPFLCDGAEEIANICDLVRRHAELFAGVDQLSTIAEQTVSTGQESVVWRRVYGRITGKRRKNELLEFVPERASSGLVMQALLASKPAARTRKLRNKDEELVVRPFLPLAW